MFSSKIIVKIRIHSVHVVRLLVDFEAASNAYERRLVICDHQLNVG